MLHLLTNANVFAPEPLGIRDILVCAGKIVKVGQKFGELHRSLQVQQRDLQGRRVIPGLIDGHVHITGGGGEAGARTRVPPIPLGRFTRAGVTTVVGLLGTDDLTRNTSALITTVNGLREEGLSAYCYTGGYHFPPATLTGSVRSDIVHIDCIIGVGELALSDHRSSQPTFDELLRLASEAHVAGLMTGKAGLAHLHMGDGERGLSMVRRALKEYELPPRVFNPTHVNRKKALFEEACELSKQGCAIDVTAFPVEEGEDAWSAADALQRYLDQDFPPDRITISSDAGGCLPVFDRQGELLSMNFGQSRALIKTLKELLDSGCDLARVLPAFTSNVAGLLRFHHKGRIAEGKDADLVVLDDSHQMTDVMANGKWHVADNKQIVYGTFEEKTN